jgi:uncharacterized protein DUF4129
MGCRARSGVARRSPPPSRIAPISLIVVVAAVLLGVAAALLSGAPPTPSTFQSTPGAFVQYSDLVIFGYVVIGGVVLWVVYRLIQRIRDPSGGQFVSRVASAWALVLALCLVFLVAARLVAHPSPGSSQRPMGNNTTVTHPPPPPVGTPGNFSLGPINAPGWEAYLGLIVLAVIVGAVAIPVSGYYLARRREAKEESPGPSASERSRAEIAATLATLEADPKADPRALIVALYGRLLSSVEDGVGGVEARTAREIEVAAVTTLGLPKEAARELTRLFEEARYSSHPITPADVDRARAALRRILDRIDAAGGAV